MKYVNYWTLLLTFIAFLRPTNARADFFGGDIPLLTEIVANTLQELTKLESIIGKGQETIDLIQDLNRGIRDAMEIIKTRNNTLTPGILSDLQNIDQITRTVEDLYGRIPKTKGSQVQKLTDTTVAEGINLHNEAFRYADQIDPEAERIKDYAREVSPLGAQKLTAQALGVLIHVMNQILRTNAAILKLQSEELALRNQGSKLASEQYKMEYEGLSTLFQKSKPSFRLNTLPQ